MFHAMCRAPPPECRENLRRLGTSHRISRIAVFDMCASGTRCHRATRACKPGASGCDANKTVCRNTSGCNALTPSQVPIRNKAGAFACHVAESVGRVVFSAEGGVNVRPHWTAESIRWVLWVHCGLC